MRIECDRRHVFEGRRMKLYNCVSGFEGSALALVKRTRLYCEFLKFYRVAASTARTKQSWGQSGVAEGMPTTPLADMLQQANYLTLQPKLEALVSALYPSSPVSPLHAFAH